MKKIIVITSLTIAILTLSGCGSKQEAAKNDNAIPNPASDPAGYLPGMVNVDQKAQQDINNAVNQENDKLNNTLNENNMDQNQNTTKLAPPEANSPLLQKYTAAIIKTSLGDIKVKFNNADTPLTVTNFLNLAQNNFYNGTKFHRVIKGFMIQGGDPNSKTANISSWGMGDPGYKFNDELKGTETYPQGTLAMANSGPNTNGSQFFIVTASPAAPLPPSYTVFGSVTEGMDVALKIENVPTSGSTGNPADHPLTDVTINSIELLAK
jgi:cyclophilin family peptidyl-prolyl cis-trans isomerase